MKVNLKSDVVQVSNNIKYRIMFVFSLALIILGFCFDSPLNIIDGMYKIIFQSDTLVTDYIGVAGMGAAFFNSGVLTLIFTYILYRMKMSFNGSTFASLFIVSGFAFFGKNIFNVWFIIMGVYLYSKYQKDDFKKYIYIAIFGTAMAPVVSELLFYPDLSLHLRLILGIGTGIFVGFILPPLATFLMRVHQGYDLYNIGFASGIIGTIIVSVYRSYGIVPISKMIWSTGNNMILSIIIYSLSVIFVIIGYILNDKSFKGLKKISKYSGRLVADFTVHEGFGISMVNMGIVGAIATTYILLIRGDLNGATIAGIFTMIGFSGLGKHPRNVIPILMGVFLGGVTKVWAITDPSIQIAALFATGLAPIAGEYGVIAGIVTAYIHSSVVLNVGVLHGGLNLYNNGFSAGFVAAFMIPILNAFRKEKI